MKGEMLIFRKELLDHVLSLRFAVGSLLFILSAAVCSSVRLHHYRQRLQAYHTLVADQEAFLDKYAHANRLWTIFVPYTPPPRMSVLLHESNPPADVFSAPEQVIEENPLDLLQPHLDFQVLIGLLGSLWALVLAYDTVSGERERGTWNLMRAHSISVARILTEKWWAGNLLIFSPLVLSVGLASIYIELDPEVNWGPEEWIAWGLSALVYGLYLSVFFTLGLLVSYCARRSSSSIIVLSFLWVAIVLLAPMLSSHVSASIRPVPSPVIVARELKRIEQERQVAARARVNELLKKGLSLGEIWASGELTTLNRPYEEKAARLAQDFRQRLAAQQRLTRRIASLSPAFCMVQAVSELAGVGSSSAEHVARSIENWRRLAGETVSRKIQKLREANPDFGWDDPLDVSDIPRFHYKERPLGERWRTASPYIGLLLLYEVGLWIVILILSQRVTD
ncbi:hypothetical protein HRbin10_01023 [bacterium HR10]|uniref:Hypothetical conserved protein n=1 Tax=uncultured Acidobacteriota bacterium TaxID=171953 RepID=H5SH73_9BACT|nr:hypothetical conserved protein [uncultured Acidobacteriota bacterium]GBC81908.1 hypothetical protein HRbin10_01023 [bacterium HR10]